MTLTPILVCIALNVYLEARGEPISDQVAAAQVVLERAADPRWHDDPCEVVHERNGNGCPFSWKCESIPAVFEPQAWTRALLIASAVLAGSGHADFSANHYHAKRVKPRWARTMRSFGDYGGQHVYFGG